MSKRFLSSLLPTHGKKVIHPRDLTPSFACKELLPQTIEKFGGFEYQKLILLAQPWNKPFTAPNCNASCLASLCVLLTSPLGGSIEIPTSAYLTRTLCISLYVQLPLHSTSLHPFPPKFLSSHFKHLWKVLFTNFFKEEKIPAYNKFLSFIIIFKQNILTILKITISEKNSAFSLLKLFSRWQSKSVYFRVFCFCFLSFTNPQHKVGCLVLFPLNLISVGYRNRHSQIQ